MAPVSILTVVKNHFSLTFQLSDGTFFVENSVVEMNISDLEYRENLAVLHVFFKEASFRSYTKSEFIGFTEFLCKFSGNFSNFIKTRAF